MRIFIHHVDSYIGRALVKELRRADGGLNRIFGTSAGEAPAAVKRIVCRDDPKKAKKMAETMQSCRLVVISLFDCTLDDLHFAISALKVDPKANPPKVLGELESECIFMVISSVMVWSATKPETPGAAIKDSDYLRRAPKVGSKFEQWKEMEDLVFSCFNREASQVKAFVVAGGLLYGEGEQIFADLFKDAWRGVQSHAIVSPGVNKVPTVHVRDMARLVRQVSLTAESINPLETPPYFLAVDQPPSQPPVSTQKDLVQGIVDEMGEHYQVPRVSYDEAMSVAELQEVREALTLDLWMEPSTLALNEDFCANSDPPGWICKNGLLANLRSMADEFCAGKKLRCMRIIIAGPPASGKSNLAKAVAEHFKVPYLSFPVPAQSSDIEKMATQITSNVIRYRGYVLDAGGIGFAEAEKLFRFDVEVPRSEEEEPPPDGEEVEPTPPKMERRLNEETCPAYVIITQAPAALCKGKWQNAGGASLEVFEQSMQAYIESNLTSNIHSLQDFFQDVANKGVLNLPIAGKDEEDLFESARIYIESSGRPFNYLPTEAEVSQEIRQRRAEKQELQEAMAASTKDADDHEAKQRREEQRHEMRLQMVAEHQAAQQKLAELSLREYLMQYMVPNLTEGLIEVCKVLPDNPVDYLANYLEHAAQAPGEQEQGGR
mmetsp:Transcript_86702/g.177053  ORF Transcript_86702/g.177053 Transcript_86702/m.177053 type:complete len:661 (+) Transcript_86702:70-2052(+)